MKLNRFNKKTTILKVSKLKTYFYEFMGKFIGIVIAVVIAISIAFAYVGINASSKSDSEQPYNDLKQVRSYFKKNLSSAAKETLLETLASENNKIWDNMSPYYTPTKKELHAIRDAYLARFIKDWDNYQIKIVETTESDYAFELIYRWPEPNMDLLNQQIEARETELKKEVDGDYQKMFKTIVRELPDMIKSLPPLPNDDEQTVQFQISRRSVYSDDELSKELSDFSKSLDKLSDVAP